MTKQSNSDIPVHLLGILSCVSDGVIVYKNNKILFTNAEGYLLLEQNRKSILDGLQFDDKTHSFHQFEIDITEKNERLIAFCISTPWEGKQANLAIIKTKREYSNLLNPSQIIEDSNQKNRNRIDLLFESAGDGYWDWYIPTASVFFSRGWKQMLGYSRGDIEPSFKSWINLIHPDDLGNFLIVWSNYMDNTDNHFSIEYRVLCKNTTYLWVEAHGVKDLNSDGEIVRLAGFHRDISERKKNEVKIREYQENLEQLVTQRTLELKYANQKLEELASQDPLTHLHNRRSFDAFLNQQIRSSQRTSSSLCLLLIDIDHFKSFNDEYGHQQGDACLKSVASAINKSIYRPVDMAARYGGEEFVVILQDTNIQGAIKVSQNIQANITALKNLPLNPTTEKHISLSIGIASFQQIKNKNTGEADLVSLADKAMYEAKNNGRDQICYFSDDLKTISYIANSPITNQAALEHAGQSVNQKTSQL